jgi:hypothetical protein
VKKNIGLILLIVFLAGCGEIRVVPVAEYRSDVVCPARVEALRKSPDGGTPLFERYKDLSVIDVHYHGNALLIPGGWDQYHIDRTVLFENISEPAAQINDKLSWLAYRLHSERIYPNFAGIPVYEAQGVTITRDHLEQGYLGIGEIVGASSHSPVTSKLAWKANHPNDGELPKIYELAAAYRVPVLLHIDPPVGYPVQMLEQAMVAHPQTLFIFAHANAYNSPGNIESLLSQHPNLYIDFFAGFTAYNPGSSHKLSDFVALIEKYPERFLVSTDGGYDIGYDHAALAIYELLDLLTPQTACRVVYQNYEQIIEAQLPTETQVARIRDLSTALGESGTPKLNKRNANELIFELENKVATRMGAGILIGILFALWVMKRKKSCKNNLRSR